MTLTEKISRVKTLLASDSTATDEIVTVYLDMAQERIMTVRYPFGFADDCDFPTKYEGIQCELAARYFARRGGLGEIAHSENGVSRTWGSTDDIDLLGKIVPIAEVR